MVSTDGVEVVGIGSGSLLTSEGGWPSWAGIPLPPLRCLAFWTRARERRRPEHRLRIRARVPQVWRKISWWRTVSCWNISERHILSGLVTFGPHGRIRYYRVWNKVWSGKSFCQLHSWKTFLEHNRCAAKAARRNRPVKSWWAADSKALGSRRRNGGIRRTPPVHLRL